MSWLASAVLVVLTQGAPAPDTVPLFASDTAFTFTLIADFEAIRKDRAEEPEDRPGMLVFAAGDSMEVGLRPRGIARRDPATCSFPPLRLNVKTGQAGGTVFQGQDKLKMVVPCRPERDAFEQYVLVEYLLYRVYELVTDRSFRTRLVRTRFVDTGGGREPFTSYAFLIEDEDALAARLGGSAVDLPEGAGVRAELLNPIQSVLMATFQYLIGNTDWSDQALHNVKLVQGLGALIPIPYDFDVTGAVDPPYAVPDPILGLRTVRDRLYRGWCFDRVDTTSLVQRFLDQHDHVRSLFEDASFLDEETRSDALRYLEEGYEGIATPERAQRRLYRDCRPPA